ncbi:hypothetical protein [Treponema endosymbiont of Eucomonympha sp.]|uniref:hypothetical protein n=1 Tax=Treponema endosymbiont of Eucomonympha sp. TaxID=1580831 RepID=UPI000751A6C6|nr:hypothetical protein [Treponema endosymbiont of Eucomonympha sp.]
MRGFAGKPHAACFALFFAARLCFPAETPVPEPYTKDSLPPLARTVRRSEIITLGSLPFTTMFATIGCSLYYYGRVQNPLTKDSSKAFTWEQQKNILAVAAVASVAVGLTDLTVSLLQRSQAKRGKSAERAQQPSAITITELKDGEEQGGAADKPENSSDTLDGTDDSPAENAEASW